jgi:hypothetical protein
MNERIKKLAEQAGFMDSWFSESGDDCEQELKKFAELIVQECARVVSQKTGPKSALNVLEHFGVEEWKQ